MKQPPPSQTQQPQTFNCPRCNSANTKFCYYNNYSLSQPRHFCKACKRYWTRGGTLRSVPVGGGCRKKNKKTINKMLNSDFLAGESRQTTTGNMNQIFNNAYDSNNQSQFNGFKPAFPSLGATSFQADITSFPHFGASPSSNMGGPKETKDDSQYRTLFPIQDILMTGYGSNKQAIMDMGAHGIEQHNNTQFDSSIYWNYIGAWPDLINHESSETSLI